MIPYYRRYLFYGVFVGRFIYRKAEFAMIEKRVSIVCAAPEKLRIWREEKLRRLLIDAFKAEGIHAADVAGGPAWLVALVISALADGNAAQVDDCDYLTVLWDGKKDPNDIVYQKVEEFLKEHGHDKLIHIPINSRRRLDISAGAVVDDKTYAHGIFLSACPSDARLARKLKRRLKAVRAPRSVARSAAARRIKKVYLSSGDKLTEDDKTALADSKLLIIAASPANEELGKNREAVDLFSHTRGRRHIHVALLKGEPKEAFPPRLLSGEVYTDPQTGEEVHIAGEALAADFSAKEKTDKNKKDKKKKNYARETLRLLAPVFGCGLDDLVRRYQQQRRNRLLRVFIGAASVAIAVTLVIISLWGAAAAALAQMEESARRTAEQEALERENAAIALRMTQEAEARNAEAVYAESVRLTREAELAINEGNALKALVRLVAATPIRGVTRELPKDTEPLLRQIMGGGRFIPLLRAPGASRPSVEGDSLYWLDSGGSAVRYDLLSGESAPASRALPAAPANSFSFSIGRDRLEFGADGMARIYSAGEIADEFFAHDSEPLGAFWARDGEIAVSFAADGVAVWGVTESAGRKAIAAHEGAIRDLWLGETLLATVGEDGRAAFFDYSGNPVLTLDAGYPLSTVEAREEISQAVTCGENGTVALWDLNSGARLWETRVPGAGVARLSPDGGAVVAGYRQDYDIVDIQMQVGLYGREDEDSALLNAEDGSVVSTFSCTGLPWYGEIFEGDLFAVQNINRVYMRSSETGEIVEDVQENIGAWERISCGAIVSEFGAVYKAFDDWHTDVSRTERTPIKYLLNSMSKLQIPSPTDIDLFLDVDVNSRVMFNFDQYSSIYDYSYIEEHSYAQGGSVVCAAFSPIGNYAVTASLDGTAAVINEAGLAWLIDAGAPVVESGFSPDGGSVILASGGRILMLPMGAFEDMRENARELTQP